DQLEQGIETFCGDHMRFIDNIDLVSTARRREKCALTQISCIVDATVCCRVYLDDVNTSRAIAREIAATLTGSARFGRRPLFTVQCPGQDAGTCGFSASSRTGKQVRMMHSVGVEGMPKRLGDVILADNLGKRLWPIPPIQGQGCVHVQTL